MEETIEWCDDAISSLDQEIRELKLQRKENRREIAFLTSAVLNKTMTIEPFQEKSISDAVRKNVQTKLVQCEMEIELLKTITGIEFIRYLKSKEHITAKNVLYNHKLVGQCQSFSFEMEFKTLEYQSEKRTCCDVKYIRIHMDCKEHSDLIKLVSRTEKSLNLLGFFSYLSYFADWYEFRRSTFAQFKEKYPLAVGLPLGSSADYIVLMNPELPGYKMMLMWKITIDEEGKVTPVLDLLPKIPEQATALDKTGVLKNAALGFKTLLRAFGIQGSIENIIQSFCFLKVSD